MRNLQGLSGRSRGRGGARPTSSTIRLLALSTTAPRPAARSSVTIERSPRHAVVPREPWPVRSRSSSTRPDARALECARLERPVPGASRRQHRDRRAMSRADRTHPPAGRSRSSSTGRAAHRVAMPPQSTVADLGGRAGMGCRASRAARARGARAARRSSRPRRRARPRHASQFSSAARRGPPSSRAAPDDGVRAQVRVELRRGRAPVPHSARRGGRKARSASRATRASRGAGAPPRSSRLAERRGQAHLATLDRVGEQKTHEALRDRTDLEVRRSFASWPAYATVPPSTSATAKSAARAASAW